MAAIRPATESDQDTIRRMVRAERLDPTGLDWRHFLIAEEDGQIVGIGQIRPHDGVNELGSLVVLPVYRGRGIGLELARALEAKAGLPLYLFTRDTTVGYYERLGYRVIDPRQAPRSLQRKYRIPALLRVFGLRIVIMRKG